MCADGPRAPAPPTDRPADAEERRRIRVFLASPSDLASERRGFKQRIDVLNAGFGDGAGVQFVAVGWEDTLASTGRRIQSVINADIDACDVFVLALFRRWGQPSPDSEFSSYTEEEFFRALQRFESGGRPEIFVFCKNVDDLSMADPGPQLQKVLAFRRQLEQTHSIRFRMFDDADGFGNELDQHLRAFAKGGLPPVSQVGLRTPLPLELVSQVERAEAEANRRAEVAEARAREEQDARLAAIQRAEAFEARAVAAERRLALESARAAGEGSLEQARQLFARATPQTTSPDVLYLASELYWQTGPLDTATQLLEQWMQMAGTAERTDAAASAMDRLGILHHIRGSLDRAEAMHRQALAIHEELASPTGVSSQLERLGQIALDRGDLAEAQELHRRALAIAQELGRTENASNQYTQLALIAQARDDPASADALHLRALTLLGGDAAPVGFLDVLTIPVVVHIVYRTVAENLADELVESQIAALNRDFRARNADLASVPFPFRPPVADARIEFRPADVDPEGRPTSGITRTRTARKGFGVDDAIKRRTTGGVEPWDTERYLNVWVGTLEHGMVGYGQFPGGEAATDGVVISGKAFGVQGSAGAPFDVGRTTTHTVAHYLGLHHIWEPEGRLDDIAFQEAPNFGSPSFPKISGNNGPFGDMFMNFMDYVDDAAMLMFTKRQVLAMHDTLRTSRGRLGHRLTGAAGAKENTTA